MAKWYVRISNGCFVSYLFPANAGFNGRMNILLLLSILVSLRIPTWISGKIWMVKQLLIVKMYVEFHVSVFMLQIHQPILLIVILNSGKAIIVHFSASSVALFSNGKLSAWAGTRLEDGQQPEYLQLAFRCETGHAPSLHFFRKQTKKPKTLPPKNSSKNHSGTTFKQSAN